MKGGWGLENNGNAKLNTTVSLFPAPPNNPPAFTAAALPHPTSGVRMVVGLPVHIGMSRPIRRAGYSVLKYKGAFSSLVAGAAYPLTSQNVGRVEPLLAVIGVSCILVYPEFRPSRETPAKRSRLRERKGFLISA